MIRIGLTDEEEQVLEQTFKTTPDRQLRDRCQAVLMASRKRSRQAIAQDLGVHRITLTRWLKRYQRQGLEGLKITWAPGQARRIPQALAPTIIEWVKGGPVSCGLERANWTYAELAVQLYRTHGIEVKETAMREFCHRHQIRPYRPTYRYLRADPRKQAAAREELEAFKKSSSRRMCAVEPG